jgi:flagellar basal body P-ring formation protein FlgA
LASVTSLRSPLATALLAAAAPLAAAPAAAQGIAHAPLPATALADAAALARAAAAVLAPAGARIEVEAGAVDGRLRLAPCARVQAHALAGTRPWGQTRVGLRCVDGPRRWAISLPLTVKVFAPALVGRAPLPAGTVLAADDLVSAVVDWAAAPAGPPLAADALLGRTLLRTVAAGQPLTAPDLKPRQWFAAGDTVRIVASGAGFAVAGEGQALSPGVEGQSARVRTESGRVLSGLPVGERRVDVAL